MDIKDSGERIEFETGAVRDMSEGKGRFDLMPLDVVAVTLNDEFVADISNFIQKKEVGFLYSATDMFISKAYKNNPFTAMLEVAKHFEAGAKKYGENNWQKGIPVSSYIDSAVRHYMKYRDGWDDEPHDRAVLWNLMCCIWTIEHKEE